MPTDNHTKSKKAYLVSLKDKLRKHLQQQIKSVYPVDRRWLNGFIAASLTEFYFSRSNAGSDGTLAVSLQHLPTAS